MPHTYRRLQSTACLALRLTRTASTCAVVVLHGWTVRAKFCKGDLQLDNVCRQMEELEARLGAHELSRLRPQAGAQELYFHAAARVYLRVARVLLSADVLLCTCVSAFSRHTYAAVSSLLHLLNRTK